ncbi:MAG: ATP-grasp domain-containing protein [Saprospiraceae bacterium]
MLNKILKTIQSFLYAVGSFSFLTILKKHNRKSSNCVLVYPDFPRDIIKYFYSDGFINDLALINAVAIHDENFKIKIGKNKTRKWQNNNIYYNMSNRFRKPQSIDYTQDLYHFVKDLEDSNICFPNSSEVLWWENKSFMHKEFDKNGIKCPKSKIMEVTEVTKNETLDFSLPFLVKEVHSAGSLGVHKINSYQELEFIMQEIINRGENEEVIIQELLEMDRDLRAIVVGEEVVLHYWRINKGKEWKPTSTRHGSDVDFITFPEEWKTHIIGLNKKLKLTAGAYDLVWVGNDYSVEPYVLEVSPSFQPNPKPPSNLTKSYGKWKSGFNLLRGYPVRFVKVVNSIKYKLVISYKKQMTQSNN